MRVVLDVGRKYLEITGPYSAAFAAELWEEVDTAGFDELVLDFSGTRVISTMAMETIFGIRQRLQSQNKTLWIANASELITNLLQTCKMTDILIQEER